MEHFLFALNALMPLLLIAIVGYFMRKSNMINASFVSGLNKIIFYVSLPVLIFVTLSNVDDLSAFNWPVIIFSVIMVTVISVLGFIYLHFSDMSVRTKEVLLQAFFRGNFVIIGVPLALRLGGQEALNIVILLNAFLIPITNVFSILSFKIWRPDNKMSFNAFKRFTITTLLNPLMVAIYFGVLTLIFNTQYRAFASTIDFVPETLQLIASTVTPMALIAVGAQFEMKQAKLFVKPIIISLVGRMILVPTMVFVLAVTLFSFIDFSGTWPAMIAVFASPIGISSVAVTKGLQGDDELASHLVLFTTAFAVISIFVLVVIFRGVGLL